MAFKKDIVEIELTDRNICLNIRQLIHLQALWRGSVVRRRISLSRQLFSDIFHELEADDESLHIYWESDSKPVQPQFFKTYDYKKLVNTREDEKRNRSSHAAMKHTPPSANSMHQAVLKAHVPSSNNSSPVEENQSSKEMIKHSSGDMVNSVFIEHFQDLVPVRDTQNDCTTADHSDNRTQSHVLSTESENNSVKQEDKTETVTESSGIVHKETAKDFTGSHTLEVDLSTNLEQTSSTCSETIDYESQLKDLSVSELWEERRAAALELLWIQQAIDSRKQYLQMKREVAS